MTVIEVLGRCPFTDLMICLVIERCVDRPASNLYFLRRSDGFYLPTIWFEFWETFPFYKDGHRRKREAMFKFHNYLQLRPTKTSLNWLVEGF